MTDALPALETLLAEVEATAAVIMKQPDVPDDTIAPWALECCSLIRNALTEGDAAFAAYAGCRLGERLAELRALGRRAAAHKPRVQRDHERDEKRRAVHKKYHEERKFSISEADEKAAAELGVSPRVIRRARRGN
jgi:hypothetical protein